MVAIQVDIQCQQLPSPHAHETPPREQEQRQQAEKEYTEPERLLRKDKDSTHVCMPLPARACRRGG